jgi:hypothetical protein
MKKNIIKLVLGLALITQVQASSTYSRSSSGSSRSNTPKKKSSWQKKLGRGLLNFGKQVGKTAGSALTERATDFINQKLFKPQNQVNPTLPQYPQIGYPGTGDNYNPQYSNYNPTNQVRDDFNQRNSGYGRSRDDFDLRSSGYGTSRDYFDQRNSGYGTSRNSFQPRSFEMENDVEAMRFPGMIEQDRQDRQDRQDEERRRDFERLPDSDLFAPSKYEDSAARWRSRGGQDSARIKQEQRFIQEKQDEERRRDLELLPDSDGWDNASDYLRSKSQARSAQMANSVGKALNSRIQTEQKAQQAIEIEQAMQEMRLPGLDTQDRQDTEKRKDFKLLSDNDRWEKALNYIRSKSQPKAESQARGAQMAASMGNDLTTQIQPGLVAQPALEMELPAQNTLLPGMLDNTRPAETAFDAINSAARGAQMAASVGNDLTTQIQPALVAQPALEMDLPAQNTLLPGMLDDAGTFETAFDTLSAWAPTQKPEDEQNLLKGLDSDLSSAQATFDEPYIAPQEVAGPDMGDTDAVANFVNQLQEAYETKPTADSVSRNASDSALDGTLDSTYSDALSAGTDQESTAEESPAKINQTAVSDPAATGPAKFDLAGFDLTGIDVNELLRG